MADEWNTVPRGVFETASLTWGLTLSQAAILSGIGIFFMIGVMLFEKYMLYIIIAAIAVEGVLFMVFRSSNGMTKGVVKEKLIYFLTSGFINKRYSGRVKNPF